MRTLMRVAIGVFVGTVLAGATTDLTAQTYLGGLRGAVKDAQGVIPGVTVTLVNEGTGVARDTVNSMNERTVVRAGYGLFWAPWQSGVQTTPGYSSQSTLQQDTLRPITAIDNPFPGGLIPISGNASGLLTGVSSAVTFIDPDRDAPRVHQYSVDIQRQLPGDMSVGLTYMGATGRHLTWGGTQSGIVNINQVDPRFLALNSPGGTNLLTQLVPNPFFGVAGAGSFATRPTIQRNQLLRPFPQFDNVNMIFSTLAKSQYHAGVIQLTKRATGWWGGRISYTYSRLDDNQFAQDNYFSNAPGILNNYTAIPWSEYFDPDAEYGRSRLDSPHKLVPVPSSGCHSVKGGAG